jgi:hypothetical protein
MDVTTTRTFERKKYAKSWHVLRDLYEDEVWETALDRMRTDIVTEAARFGTRDSDVEVQILPAVMYEDFTSRQWSPEMYGDDPSIPSEWMLVLASVYVLHEVPS